MANNSRKNRRARSRPHTSCDNNYIWTYLFGNKCDFNTTYLKFIPCNIVVIKHFNMDIIIPSHRNIVKYIYGPGKIVSFRV